MQGNKPVAYASKSLTKTEYAYAQIEKEVLAIVFDYKQFGFRETASSGATSFAENATKSAALQFQINQKVRKRYPSCRCVVPCI